MHVAHASYSWFIFNLKTEISLYLQIIYYNIYTTYIASPNPTPCFIPYLLTWRTSFFAYGDEYPSTIVSGLPTTAPPLCLPSHPFTPHSSNYIIYIDDISNLSRLRPGQCLCLLITWLCLLYNMPVSPYNLPCTPIHERVTLQHDFCLLTACLYLLTIWLCFITTWFCFLTTYQCLLTK